MGITTVSSREPNRDIGRAKRAAKDGPVHIADQGRPADVLPSIEDYRRIPSPQASIADLLAMPGTEAIDFEPPRLAGELYRSADLS